MSISISNNRILITDSSGLKTVFDTNTKMPVIKSIAEGSVTFPQRTAPHGTITQDHTLVAGLDADVNFIYALGQLTGSYGSTGHGSNPYENTALYSPSSGSGRERARPWIPMMGSAPALFTVFAYSDDLPGAIRAITIFRSGTTLYAREQVFSRSTAVTPEQGLNYKIFLGAV